MAIRIDPKPDERAERMVSNPSGYFEEACEQLRAEVVEDMNRRRDHPRPR